MAHDQRPGPAPRLPWPPAAELPLGLWALWTFAVVVTALWVAWPALLGSAPLDTPRLVIRSALVGVAGLLALTVLEIRVAPWRFLD